MHVVGLALLVAHERFAGTQLVGLVVVKIPVCFVKRDQNAGDGVNRGVHW